MVMPSGSGPFALLLLLSVLFSLSALNMGDIDDKEEVIISKSSPLSKTTFLVFASMIENDREPTQ